MRAWLLTILPVLPLAWAQGGLSSTLTSYPPCAQTCVIGAFTAQLCAPTDPVCICYDATFRSNVTACVQEACTVIEALGTQNISLSTCGAPVRDRSNELLIYTFSMMSFTLLLAFIRFVYKITMKLDIGLDDWILVATIATVVPQTVLFMEGTLPNGLGKDIWTLASGEITNFLKYWYITAIIYFLQTTLVKLAFVAFYLRIFTTRNSRKVLWITFTIVTLWGLSFVIVASCVCKPISYMWTQWDGLHDGECLSDAAYVWTNAASNIALDFWILALPLWELRKLQLHWKKKIGVALMFGLGALVTVMSILRLKSLMLYQARNNVTWEFAEVYIWSSIEINVGVICACLPTLRLLLVKIWPVLAGSTVRKSDQWYRKSGKDSQGYSSTGHSSYAQLSSPAPVHQAPHQELKREGVSRKVSINGRNLSIQHVPRNGIQRDESFDVHCSEGSDISLVLMRPSPGSGKDV